MEEKKVKILIELTEQQKTDIELCALGNEISINEWIIRRLMDNIHPIERLYIDLKTKYG